MQKVYAAKEKDIAVKLSLIHIWPGNPTPRIAEVYGGMLNAIGLQNPGIDVFTKRDIPFLKPVAYTHLGDWGYI